MVERIGQNNQIREYTNEEMNFRYRNSRIWDEGLIVLGVELDLESGEYSAIEEVMKDLTYRRTSKQPLELPSGGSTFKRPEDILLEKLLRMQGLRGLHDMEVLKFQKTLWICSKCR